MRPQTPLRQAWCVTVGSASAAHLLTVPLPLWIAAYACLKLEDLCDRDTMICVVQRFAAFAVGLAQLVVVEARLRLRQQEQNLQEAAETQQAEQSRR